MYENKRIFKQPWPTKDAMQQIYNEHLWGGKEFDFYSGDGSHNPKITKPYLDAVTYFFKSQNNALVVCDLGCGDFNIGKHLVEHTQNYIAIDIVDVLIERNKSLFQHDNLEFHCLDVVKDKLPEADCIILRQVLQHLSNEEIQKIIRKITAYKYAILTEHLPFGQFEPNKNKIASQGIRLKQHSGVDVSETPFNLKFKAKKTLAETVLDNNKGKIKTILYTLQ